MMEYYETIGQALKDGDTEIKAMDVVRSVVPPSELWAQLAEEATELAHAALKIRRAIEGTNPTPVSPADACAAVMEELADVTLLVNILYLDTDPAVIEETCRRKLLRWCDRLQTKEEARENDT